MKSIEVQERQKRKIDEITDSKKIFSLIKAHLAKQPLLIKGDFSHQKVEVRRIDPANSLILIECPKEWKPPEKIRLYKILGRYVELEGEIAGTKGPGNFIIKVTKARIASFARSHPRYPVVDKTAYVTNIKTSQNTINASIFSIPTSVKVHFNQAQMMNANLADVVKIATFDGKDEKMELIRKSKKALWIRDTQDIASYIPENDDYVDYQGFLGVDIGMVMNKYKQEKVVSEIIVPVIYIDQKGDSIPLGYVQMQSHKEEFDQFKFLELKELTFSLIDKIRDSNTVTIKDRQKIIDISEGGLKIKVENTDLQGSLVHQPSFSFDVVFKMQQPLTLFGLIRSTYKDNNNNLIVGIQIHGSSSRGKEEIHRYAQYVRTFFEKKD